MDKKTETIPKNYSMQKQQNIILFKKFKNNAN